MDLKILYEDNSIIVFRKPAGLATETARVGRGDAVSELRNELARRSGSKAAPYLGVVHRLDQPVEGLLVFARTREAAAELSAELRDGVLHKAYRAVICGQLSPGEGTLVDYLYKNAQSKSVVVPEKQAKQTGAKRAVLHYRTVKTREVWQDAAVAGAQDMRHGEALGSPLEAEDMDRPDLISLVDIRIDTGRFHQIRAQLAHGGHAILGDQKYGDERTLGLSRVLGVGYVALCACQLEFLHPKTGERLCFFEEPSGAVFGKF